MIPNATHADLPARHLTALMGVIPHPSSAWCPRNLPPIHDRDVNVCSYVRAWLPNTATTDRLHYIPHICRRDAGRRCGGAVARCTSANHECNCGVEGPYRLDVSDNSVTAPQTAPYHIPYRLHHRLHHHAKPHAKLAVCRIHSFLTSSTLQSATLISKRESGQYIMNSHNLEKHKYGKSSHTRARAHTHNNNIRTTRTGGTG